MSVENNGSKPKRTNTKHSIYSHAYIDDEAVMANILYRYRPTGLERRKLKQAPIKALSKLSVTTETLVRCHECGGTFPLAYPRDCPQEQALAVCQETPYNNHQDHLRGRSVELDRYDLQRATSAEPITTKPKRVYHHKQPKT